MQRILPPLLLLAVFGVIAARCAMEPSRAAGREHIRGLVQGRQFRQAERHLARYAARFEDPEDRWFAAEMFFRMNRHDEAIDAILKHPTIPQEEGAARRFAEIGLFALGWSTEDRVEATLSEPRALVVLVEGRDPWAEERLRRHALEYDLPATTRYFYPAYRMATRHPMEILTRAFRERGEQVFDVAAALGSLHAEDYPERERDLAILSEVVLSPDWRERHLQVWGVACYVLGRSSDADALDTLRTAEARLEGSSRPRDRDDLLLLRNGLVAAGEWRVDEEVAENALGPDPILVHANWYLEALIHRYRVGDMRAEARLRQLWNGFGARYPDLRYRLARAFLLQDEPPQAPAIGAWVDTMLRDLEAGNAPLMARVLARAHHLRAGTPGARARLVEILYEAAAALRAENADPFEAADPLIEALRALYLYD